MSLDSRLLAALGAVVVVGAATVGGSVAFASDQTAHSDHRVTVTVGRNSSVHDPFCFNDGQPLSQADLRTCSADAKAAFAKNKLPSLDVRLNDRIGVGVTPTVSDTGWMASSNGGAESAGGEFPLMNYAKKVTFSGLQPATSVLNASGKTIVSVQEGSSNGKDLVALWYFVLNTKED
ncbi:hypothetical protein [Streptomyces sp. NRRL WC-3742]|uniref:hypothetical protein n=1 Tax=Streptomyces sp. NRRL WC-3742 TaxID=1463934 RepID=UPI0004C488D0|nr:hypothetical protein [Streptomyces sp. NRRL WC-3742]